MSLPGGFIFAGGRYVGETNLGKPHGKGALYRSYDNFLLYDGDWRDGERHGRGTSYLADGSYYEGEYKDGKAHGQGVFYHANGNRYEGEYRDDWAHGQGTLYYANGDRWEGIFRNGKQTNQGTLYSLKGSEDPAPASDLFGHLRNLPSPKTGPPKREHISDKLRDRIFRKCEYRCVATWVIDPSLDRETNELCGSKVDLEVDHITPVSKGGKSTYQNLELLCKKHNRMKGTKEYKLV